MQLVYCSSHLIFFTTLRYLSQRINQLCNSDYLNYSSTFSDHPFGHVLIQLDSAFLQMY